MRYVLLVLFLCLNLQAIAEPMGEETVTSPPVLTATTPDSEPLSHTVSWDNKIATVLHASTWFLGMSLGGRYFLDLPWALNEDIPQLFKLYAKISLCAGILSNTVKAYSYLVLLYPKAAPMFQSRLKLSQTDQSINKKRKAIWGGLTLMTTALFAYWIAPITLDQTTTFIKNSQFITWKKDRLLTLAPDYFWAVKWLPLVLPAICSRYYLEVDHPMITPFAERCAKTNIVLKRNNAEPLVLWPL
jgi:hypothetical protein